MFIFSPSLSISTLQSVLTKSIVKMRGGRAVETLQCETLWALMSFGTSYPRAQALFKGIVVYLNALLLTDGDDSLG